MAKQIGKKTPRKWQPTFINSVLMVALVLFIFGIIGMIALHYQELSTQIRENLQIRVFLEDSVNELEGFQLQKKLETHSFVKSTDYISKEDAKETWEEMTGDDLDEVLGINPLPASVNIYLNASYANQDSIRGIRQVLDQKYGQSIYSIEVDESLAANINTNLRMIGLILLGVIILLLLIAILLIDSTVRLAMYSNRFLIKSMQMVGATRWFITKPYIFRGVVNGLLSGLLAVAAIITFVYLAQQYFPPLKQLQNLWAWAILLLLIIVIGVGISLISTWRAVTKYLKTKLDELY